MYNVSDETWALNLGQLARVKLDDRELEKFALRQGDLLVSRVNSLELVGKCAWVDAEADGYVFENMLIRVRVNEMADSLFIAQQMMTRALKERIQRVAKRAIGQASINSEDIRNLEFILPSLPEQRAIALRINAEFEQAQSLREQLAQKLAAVERLPTTLLREAFSGRV
jgi:type I restriction enzyme S subunit